MTSNDNKHRHVEYNELNGCHFNPMAEEFADEDSTHTIIRWCNSRSQLKRFWRQGDWLMQINSFLFFICATCMSSSKLSKTQLILRSGGCFVSICRGISIFMVLLVFLFFLSFTIFFSTKYAYEVSDDCDDLRSRLSQSFIAQQTKPNLTLVEFLNHRNFLIEKYAKIPKYIIPKQFHLVLHPRFDEAISNTTKNLEEFTYSGYIYVTVVSKKNSNKRIELNAKNLKIIPEDVSVYRSLTWSSIDFDDDPDWNSREIKYIVVQRNKRDVSQAESSLNDTIDDANNGGEVMDSAEQPDVNELSFNNESMQTRNKTYFYPKFVSCCYRRRHCVTLIAIHRTPKTSCR